MSRLSMPTAESSTASIFHPPPTVADGVSFPQALDLVSREIPFTTALVLTVMPRGTLQIVQPQRVSESLLRAYQRDHLWDDRIAWRAIVTGRAVSSSQAYGSDDETTPYLGRFLRGQGLKYAAAAPVAHAVFEGYPGVLWLGRSAEQGDFSAEELATLEALAAQLSELLVRTRQERLPEGLDLTAPWRHTLPEKVFIFDEHGHRLHPTALPPGLNKVLYDDHMVRAARAAIEQHATHRPVNPRVALPDADGDLWTFRIVVAPSLGGVVSGPVAVMCLQPQASDWLALSNHDFAADSELTRLMPAVRYMAREFRSSPTLNDIAKQVHLSPFHFHRRFTELFGLTPKHFLLEFQIDEAKRELVARQKPLPQLATDCGFAHQSHFTSRFKQSTGLTPTRWRRLAARRLTTESGQGQT